MNSAAYFQQKLFSTCDAYLIIQQAGAGQVVPVFTDLQPSIGKDLVVVGPGRSRQVDDFVRVMGCQKFTAHLNTPQ